VQNHPKQKIPAALVELLKIRFVAPKEVATVSKRRYRLVERHPAGSVHVDPGFRLDIVPDIQ
jgi:hypothetical protein